MPQASNAFARSGADLPACTCGQLRRLTRRITGIYDHALAPCGLRVTQFSLLSNLMKLPACSLAELAQAMDMERTTLIRNLRPLAAAGWVRTQTRANTRQREVSLTPAGRAKWSVARPLWRSAQDAVNSTLGSSEVTRLHRRMARYLSLLRGPNSGG